jgi:hypothetical protein
MRNIFLGESWRGGNDKPVSNGFLATAKILLTGLYHLLFGQISPTEHRVLTALTAIGSGIVIVSAALFVPRRGLARKPRIDRAAGMCRIEVLSYAIIYTVGMFYLGMTSVISFGTRMFVPLVPILLILICIAFDALFEQTRGLLKRSALWLACFALGIAYGGDNLLSATRWNAPAPHAIAEQKLAKPLVFPPAVNASMRAWIEARLRPQEALTAAGGQATAYVLRRNVISILGREYASEDWDAAFLHAAMQHYRSRYLLLYTPLDGTEPEEEKDWPFLRNLVQGVTPPWLARSASSTAAVLFECSDCGQSQARLTP